MTLSDDALWDQLRRAVDARAVSSAARIAKKLQDRQREITARVLRGNYIARREERIEE